MDSDDELVVDKLKRNEVPKCEKCSREFKYLENDLTIELSKQIDLLLDAHEARIPNIGWSAKTWKKTWWLERYHAAEILKLKNEFDETSWILKYHRKELDKYKPIYNVNQMGYVIQKEKEKKILASQNLLGKTHENDGGTFCQPENIEEISNEIVANPDSFIKPIYEAEVIKIENFEATPNLQNTPRAPPEDIKQNYHLTLEEKLKVLEIRKANPKCSLRQMCALFLEATQRRITEGTLRGIYKNEKKILASQNLLGKTNEVRVRPEIEIDFMNELEIQLNNVYPQEKITYERAQVVIMDLKMSEKFSNSPVIQNNKFKKCWFRSFMKNFGFRGNVGSNLVLSEGQIEHTQEKNQEICEDDEAEDSDSYSAPVDTKEISNGDLSLSLMEEINSETSLIKVENFEDSQKIQISGKRKFDQVKMEADAGTSHSNSNKIIISEFPVLRITPSLKRRPVYHVEINGRLYTYRVDKIFKISVGKSYKISLRLHCTSFKKTKTSEKNRKVCFSTGTIILLNDSLVEKHTIHEKYREPRLVRMNFKDWESKELFDEKCYENNSFQLIRVHTCEGQEISEECLKIYSQKHSHVPYVEPVSPINSNAIKAIAPRPPREIQKFQLIQITGTSNADIRFHFIHHSAGYIFSAGILFSYELQNVEQNCLILRCTKAGCFCIAKLSIRNTWIVKKESPPNCPEQKLYTLSQNHRFHIDHYDKLSLELLGPHNKEVDHRTSSNCLISTNSPKPAPPGVGKITKIKQRVGSIMPTFYEQIEERIYQYNGIGFGGPLTGNMYLKCADKNCKASRSINPNFEMLILRENSRTVSLKNNNTDENYKLENYDLETFRIAKVEAHSCTTNISNGYYLK